MKKLAILALLCAVVASHGATIKWAVGGKLYGVDSEGTSTLAYTDANGWNSDFANGTFVLVYLGINADPTTAANVTSSMIVQTLESMSDLVVTTGKQNQIGNASKLQSWDVDDVAGATYQVFFSMDGKLSDIYTSSSMSSPAQNTAVVSKDAAGAYSANTLYAAGSSGTASYVAVPEPSTAMLALAGLALLLKRRKA